jgi:3-oxoacyl-[acyl-carrier-protein] synthase I
VGLGAAPSCAAFRAKVTNPTETRFIDSQGEWIMAHQVPSEPPWRGVTKLAKMAALAIAEAVQDVPREALSKLPLLLCVAEAERPGRMPGLDDRLLLRIEAELGFPFSAEKAIVAHGRVGVAVALARARALMAASDVRQVLVAATDSLVWWPTLSHFERQDRLLTGLNSNGFIPGEAAGALLLGAPTGSPGELVCTGIGFGREAAHIDSEQPLRGDGLSQAVKAALAEAGCELHEMAFRITDTSGEQFYFKEAALALLRTMRMRKPEFDIWHPAECTGESGAAAGVAIIASARAACEKRYALGPNILAHMGNDAGDRAALALQFRAPP